ncbi:MAG: hypothetical protein IJ851_07590 [Eubacterium sp.]|nr:hypothetical protein [Eubacterium sp.]
MPCTPHLTHPTAEPTVLEMFYRGMLKFKKQEMITIEKKEKYAYWQLPSQVEQMDKVLPLSNCVNRSDFVRTAIDFYIGYLLQNENVDYLSPMITSVIKNEIQHTEKGLCEMLFKMAVELGKFNRLAAAYHDYTGVDWQALNKVVKEEVAYTNGYISLETADELINGNG